MAGALTPTPAPKPKSLQQTIQRLTLQARVPNALSHDRPVTDPFSSHVKQVVDQSLGSSSEQATDKQNPNNDDEDTDRDEESNEDSGADEPGPEDGFFTPGLDPQGQPIKDEQTVNVFLLAFLSALTASSVPFHTCWVAERNTLLYQRTVRYIAKTDGHLRDSNNGSRSIIEVKSRVRADDTMIRVQESAQMAAWIKQTRLESHDHESDCRYLSPILA